MTARRESRHHRLIRLAYRAALRTYPPSVRRRFGSEMESVFARSWANARRAGLLAALTLLVRTIRDVSINAGGAWWRLFRTPRWTRSRGRRSAGVSETMSAIIQDLRYAFRSFLRRPSFSLVALTTMAVGVGATTTVFSVVDGVLLRPMPYEDAERLVVLGTTWRQIDGTENPAVSLMSSAALSSTAAPNFFDWRARTTSFQNMAGTMGWNSMILVGDGEPERLRMGEVSDAFFSLLGIMPARGRGFTPDDYAPGAPRVGILSYGLWQRRWGGDPDIIGRTVTEGPEPFTVIGIMPRGLRMPEALWMGSPDLWFPQGFTDPIFNDRQRRVMRVLARLEPGITLETARQELDALGAALAQEYPELTWRNSQSLIAIRGLHDETVGAVGDTLYVLLGAVGLLLLIACVNLANLFLARGTDREREFAVRIALGAGRSRIVRQLLTESLLLAVLGGIVGVGIAFLGVEAFRTFSPGSVPRLAEVVVDLRTLAVALSLSALTGVVFGLVPAIRGARRDAAETMREGMAATSGRSRHAFRYGLVAGETAITLVLLVGAGLLFHSFIRLRAVDPGFDPENVLTMRVRLPDDRTDAQRVTFFSELVSRVGALPGAASTGAIVNLPIGDVNWRTDVIADVPGVGDEPGVPVNIHLTTPGYFSTLGIRLLEGRDLALRDDANGQRVVIVNETLAAMYWTGRKALGGRLKISSRADGPWATIVGVVNDVHQAGLGEEIRPELFLPYAQEPFFSSMAVAVKYEGNPTALADAMRKAVWAIDGTLPVLTLRTMEEWVSLSVVEPRFYAILFGTFALVALILAAAGIYGTMLYTVSQRTRELGIRMALGANAGSVLRMVVHQGMLVTGLGLAVGIGGAVALSGTLSGFVFDIGTGDPITYASVAALLATVAFAGCWLPARRATRVDPVLALRSE